MGRYYYYICLLILVLGAICVCRTMHRLQVEEEHGPLLLPHVCPHTRTSCYLCVYRLQVEEELGPLHSADLDVLELEAEELELQVLQASFCRS